MWQRDFNNNVSRMSSGEDLFGICYIHLMTSSVVKGLKADRADPVNIRCLNTTDTASADNLRDLWIESRMPAFL